MSEVLTTFQCPNCSSSLPLDGSVSNHTCDACLTQFKIDGYLCPHCHQHHDALNEACNRCGGAMTRLCRRCLIHNSLIDEYCKSCGNAVDLVDVGVMDHRWRTVKLRESVVSESINFREASAQTVEQVRNTINESERIRSQQEQVKLDIEFRQAKALWQQILKVVLAIAAIVLCGYLIS